MIKLMLLREVKDLGQPGDVVKVRPGYARNFLLPRRLAAPVSKDAERQVEAHRRRLATESAKREEEARIQAERLATVSVHVEARANELGNLYGSVTAAMIAEAIGREGVNVDADGIQLENPIKDLGIYEVPVTVFGDISATVKLYVVQPPPPAGSE